MEYPRKKTDSGPYLEWETIDGGRMAEIVGYKSTMTFLVVPETLGDRPVYSIRDAIWLDTAEGRGWFGTFSDLVTLRRATFPAGFAYIGSYAFPMTTLVKAPKGSFAASWAKKRGYRLELL